MLKKLLHNIKIKFLNLMQDKLIFKPLPSNVTPMKEPNEYGLDQVSAQDIQAEDGVSIHLWLKDPEDENSPVFIIFHGNTGHFGDVGARKKGETHDPQYRIRLLEDIVKRGYGIIAVSLRGFGKSGKAKPGEEGFAKDIKAVIKFALEEKKFHSNRIILLGESLGAAVAMMAAEEMTRIDKPPAVVAKVAAFSSMKWKVLELHPDLLEEKVEKAIRHKFDSEHRIKMLSEKTHLYIAHPSEDAVTGKHHSKKLADLAKEHGLKVTHTELAGAGHITWSPKEVISGVLEVYEMHQKAKEKIKKQ